MKSYTECPLFSFSGRHIPVTFIFKYPTIPPGLVNESRYRNAFMLPELVNWNLLFCIPDCEHSLQFASQLLGVESESLVKSIIFRQITASHSTRRKSVFMKPCTVEEANTRRDCLAKLLYSRLVGPKEVKKEKLFFALL